MVVAQSHLLGEKDILPRNAVPELIKSDKTSGGIINPVSYTSL